MKKLIFGIILTLALAVTAVPVFAANGQGTLDHVVISPDPGVMIPGGPQQFIATSLDVNNHVLTGVTYLWEVVANGGSINTSTGYFVAGPTPGTYTNTIKVTASKGGLTATDTATVIVANHGDLYKVVISPESATVQPLGTQLFTAVAKDAFGTDIMAGVTFVYDVLQPLSGSFAVNTGSFTAGNIIGTYTDAVRVTANQVGALPQTDTATVIVANPGVLYSVTISPDTAKVVIGGTKQFSVTAKDAFNTTIATGVTYAWAVTGVGNTIDGTGKFIAGTTVGTYTITVTATQTSTATVKSDTATVTVVAKSTREEPEGVPHGWSQGKKNGWHGGTTPPGWSKGNKTGWSDEDSPPGLLNMKNGDQGDEDED